MLRVSDLGLGYSEEPVLEGVNLEVPGGKFVSLVGPSGSGKTSILRAITGLLRPHSGRVDLTDGQESVGYLFQDDALLPWRTVHQNVALGLRIRKIAKAKALTDTTCGSIDWDLKVLAGVSPTNYPAGKESASLSLKSWP